ncbi:MAG: hypothetical protein JNK64_24495 [Myxococcales bacterium]|nr:hypothetical protein [Myxococcales bacterium]
MRLALIVAMVVVGCSHPAPAPSAPPGDPVVTAPPPSPPPGSGDACLASPDVTSAGDACTADADCVVTNFPGCCACPQCSTADPVARSRTAAAQAEAACAAASCDASICAIAGMCRPGETAAHFTPRCCGGACVGVRALPRD